MHVFSKAENQEVGVQYARALLDMAQSRGELEVVHTDVDTLAAVMKENDGLSEVLVNPLVPSKKKTSLINKIAAEASFNQFSTNFLNLLVDKGRIDCIVEVVEAFEELYCEATDTQVAIVKSAVALEEEQQFLIAKKIQELTQSKSIKIKPIVDEDLIGGFVVEYGSSQIDLSVRGAFERVKRDISTVL